MASDDPRMNVLDRVEESGTKGAMQRVIAYAESKGYTKTSELWQWADILGLTVELCQAVPLAFEDSMKGTANKHLEAVKEADADLRKRAADIAAAAAASIHVKAKEAVKRIAGQQEASQGAMRKTGAELMEGYTIQINTILVGAVQRALDEPVKAALYDIGKASQEAKRLADLHAGAVSDSRWMAYSAAAVSAVLTAVLILIGQSLMSPKKAEPTASVVVPTKGK